jgi:ribosome-associated protein
MRSESKNIISNNANPDMLVKSIVDVGLEARGMDIVILNMEGYSDITDRFVLITGRSDRHVQGIANRIYDTLCDCGNKPAAVEGLDEGVWVLLDYGTVIVHVFYETTRAKYDLEGFWRKVKRGTVTQQTDGTWMIAGDWKLNSAA